MVKRKGGTWYGGGISVVILCFLLISCGARKTHKTETVETVKKDSVAKTKEITVSESELNKQTTVCEENFTIEPIDTIKPIEVTDASGKVTKYKNARMKRQAKISSFETAYSDKKVQISEKQVEKTVSSTKKQSQKETERESPIGKIMMSLFFFILIIVLLAFLYYKDKIKNYL